MQLTQDSPYVLVSACRNEGAYIEQLIDCISAQTVKPKLWVIIDDGSNDDTYERAAFLARELPFIEVVRMPGGRPRSFASQVYAANHGWSKVQPVSHEFIGFLDADIRVAPDYYERLIHLFRCTPRLGLCGGAVIDQYVGRTDNIRRGSESFHVPGGVQMFRRQCFDSFGGYIPMEGGGQDTVADVMTLMKGWTIKVVTELTAMHLRPEGYAKDNVFVSGIKWGKKFYLLGYHPLFYMGQCLRRIWRKPFLIGSICQLIGFAIASLRAERRPVGVEFVRFHRKIQWNRVIALVSGKFGFGTRGSDVSGE